MYHYKIETEYSTGEKKKVWNLITYQWAALFPHLKSNNQQYFPGGCFAMNCRQQATKWMIAISLNLHKDI